MRSKMLSTSTHLILVLFLFAFRSIGGEGSGEVSGVSIIESSGGNEACGPGNLNATISDTRSLQSPNYPNKYPSLTECWWTITAPVGYQILINVTTFELEKCCDFLQVYDATSQAKAKRSHKHISSTNVTSPASILSSSNYFTMKFTSDISIQQQGFEMTYRATIGYIACPTLPTPSNGGQLCYIGKDNTFYCRFFCKKRFKLSGSERRWCKSNGNWTGNEVTCVEITSCGECPAPEHGRKTCTDSKNFNSICNFTCNDGYELFGSDTRSCSRDELKWSGRDTSCKGSPPTAACQVDTKYICNGYYNCLDKSDEKGCTCPYYKFKCVCYETGCPSGKWCIPQSRRCDGADDCIDRSDERDCQCSDKRFQCKYGECIDRSKVNDGSTDCVLGDDEFSCDRTLGHVHCDCMHEDDLCTTSDRCIPKGWIGDTIPDCGNHSDEPCNVSKVWCDECWVIINKCSTNRSKNILLRHLPENETRCYSQTKLSDETTMFQTNWVCITSACGKCLDMFQCQSGQFIDNEHYCNVTHQCNDGSDETTKGFGFRCSGKSRKKVCVLPQKNLFDDVVQCADGSDLCFVNGEFRCFSCLDGKLIVSAKQVCDGKIDCYDMSDECLCSNQSVCDAVMGEETTRCSSNQMHCYNDTDCVDMNRILCNSSVNCKNEKNRKFCHDDQKFNGILRCTIFGEEASFNTITATLCDGRPECDLMEDECDCIPQPSFCNDRCGQLAKMFVSGSRVCDGYVNKIMRGNRSCDQEVEKNCPMRFYCKSKDMISIDERSVCDGIIDCDNDEDEAHELCGENKSLFSDHNEMIANPILRTLFWIMGLLALIGNLFIGFNTAKNIFFRKKYNIVKLANDTFILNLTLSDFLMGVYLIAVVAQGRNYSGYYGTVDKEWRSSNFCLGLGTLAFLSSETSAFIMAFMTTLRLITVCNPFISKSIKIKWIIMAGCFCWILSFLLAAIPWFPFRSGYFISDIWFPNFFLKTNTVSKSDILRLAQRALGANDEQISWFEVKEIVSNVFKFNPIKGEFGYYSGTSVCMPRLYATTNEAAWQYSTFLITLNFVLFIYMVFAYVLVYKMATRMNKSRSAKKDPNKGMQKRISRLLLTDFCCWIPVCIMGYVSVAGVSLPPNAYLASAGFLLPINSALNPILYSKFIGYQASRAKKWISLHFGSSMSSCLVGKTDVVESCENKPEEVELRVIEVSG